MLVDEISQTLQNSKLNPTLSRLTPVTTKGDYPYTPESLKSECQTLYSRPTPWAFIHSGSLVARC